MSAAPEKLQTKSDDDSPATTRMETATAASDVEVAEKVSRCSFRMFAFASPWDNFVLAVGILSFIIEGALLPIFMLIFGDMINSFGDPFADAKPVVYYVKIEAIIAGVSFVCGFIGTACVEWAAEQQLAKIRDRYVSSVMRQEQGWFDSLDPSVLSSKLNQNCVLIREAIGVKFGQIFFFGAMFVGGLIVGMVREWRLGLVTIGALPFVAAGGYFMMRSIARAGEQTKAAYEGAASVAEEAVTNMRTVTAFSAEGAFLTRYTKNLDDSFRAGTIGGLGQGFGLAVTMAVLFWTYALGFWFGSFLIVRDLEGGCDYLMGECFMGGTALAAFLSIVFAAFSVGQAGPNVSAFMKGQVAAAELFKMIDRRSLIDYTDPSGMKDVDIQGGISFKDVAFAYPTRKEKPVFSELNLEIVPGTSVALVGPSGCGKSSVVQLLERFYDVHSGTISLDGHDIRDYNLPWMRSQIAIVSQEPKLFAVSIAENIRYGRLDATRAEIEEAAKMANAYNFIQTFPQGFETLVGDGGSQLSGGQKQRIAIARAVLRKAKIIILDEATSALDNESEKIVQSTLDQLIAKTKRTTIIIAHRLTTIRNADKIVVLDNTTGLGSVVIESGTHSELMQNKSGLYFNLVKSQSGGEGDAVAEDASALAARLAAEMKDLPAPGVEVPDGLRPEKTQSFIQMIKKYSSINSRAKGSYQAFGNDEQRALGGSFAKPTEATSGCCGTCQTSIRNGICGPKKEPNPKPQPGFCRISRLLRKDWWKVLIGSIGAVVNGALFPVFAIVFAKFLVVYFMWFDTEKMKSEARLWALVIVGMGVIQLLAQFCQTAFFEWAGHRLIRELRSETFEAMLHQDISFFDNPENAPGTLLQILSSDITLVKGWVGDNTGIVVQSASGVVCGIIIAFVASWRLALVCFAAFLVMAPASILEARFLHGSSEANADSATSVGAVLNECISSIQTVAAFNLQEEFHGRFMDLVDRELRKGSRKAVIFGFFFGFSQFAQFGGAALSYWYGDKLYQDGQISNAEEVFRATFALMFAAMGFGQASMFAADSAKAKEAARQVYYVRDHVSAMDVRDKSGRLLEEDELKGRISVKGLRFSYPQRPEAPVYKNVEFEVEEGETVALVGESGCGKSTVIQLLERFYDPEKVGEQEGIFLDNVNLTGLQLTFLRQQLGLVSQEPILFDATIFDNIAYGNPSANEQEIVAAAKMSNAHDFIMQFPDGYKTSVGKKGGRLSGGQKQRVAIARAMLRDPKILLLDEATSALDAESERIVQQALDNVLEVKKRTTIVIAHRLSTVRKADKIVVLTNEDRTGSSVAEIGTHESLLAIPGGVYANLIKIQEAASQVAAPQK